MLEKNGLIKRDMSRDTGPHTSHQFSQGCQNRPDTVFRHESHYIVVGDGSKIFERVKLVELSMHSLIHSITRIASFDCP